VERDEDDIRCGSGDPLCALSRVVSMPHGPYMLARSTTGLCWLLGKSFVRALLGEAKMTGGADADTCDRAQLATSGMHELRGPRGLAVPAHQLGRACRVGT